MKRLLQPLSLPAVILLCAGFACDKNTQSGMTMVRPGQSVELPLEGFVLAQRPCANWAWAAALETLLRRQDVDLKQEYWVVKAYGGAVCREPGAPPALARAVTGNYTLDDGRKVRLEAEYVSGAPRSVDDLIVRLHNGQPFLLFWNSQAYLLRGVVYDEHIAPSGERMFQVRELKLLDLHPQARQRETTFDRERHDPASIQGLMMVTATPILGTDWKRSN